MVPDLKKPIRVKKFKNYVYLPEEFPDENRYKEQVKLSDNAITSRRIRQAIEKSLEGKESEAELQSLVELTANLEQLEETMGGGEMAYHNEAQTSHFVFDILKHFVTKMSRISESEKFFIGKEVAI
jgi:hypothetical protein